MPPPGIAEPSLGGVAYNRTPKYQAGDLLKVLSASSHLTLVGKTCKITEAMVLKKAYVACRPDSPFCYRLEGGGDRVFFEEEIQLVRKGKQ